jgi:hypothetical protein
MDEWLVRMRHDLKLAGLAAHTVNIYPCSAADFASFNELPPNEAAQEEARAWIEHLTMRSLSAPRLRQHSSPRNSRSRVPSVAPRSLHFYAGHETECECPVFLAPARSVAYCWP